MMCLRFEAKHQEIKAYTNVSCNRKNVCLSVGRKFAFKFADFLLRRESITILFEDFKEWNEYPNDQLLATVEVIHPGQITAGKKINFKGTDYSVDNYIVSDNGAIIIKNFLKTQDNEILVVFKKVNYIISLLFY